MLHFYAVLTFEGRPLLARRMVQKGRSLSCERRMIALRVNGAGVRARTGYLLRRASLDRAPCSLPLPVGKARQDGPGNRPADSPLRTHPSRQPGPRGHQETRTDIRWRRTPRLGPSKCFPESVRN